MIVSFVDAGTEDIYNGRNTRGAGRACPLQIHVTARKRLDTLQAATSLDDVASNPGANLEELKRARKGQHSVRINRKYRVCFRWTSDGPADVEIVDYHDE
jgi:toxin HigB-1